MPSHHNHIANRQMTTPLSRSIAGRLIRGQLRLWYSKRGRGAVCAILLALVFRSLPVAVQGATTSL